jgi:hypothetical protein
MVTGAHPDPDFDDQAQLIREYWQAATDQAQIR